MKKELERLLAEADRLYKLSILDEDMLEEESDKYYSEYHDVLHEIADWVVKFSMGQIDKMTAFKMAVHKRSELLSLANPAGVRHNVLNGGGNKPKTRGGNKNVY